MIDKKREGRKGPPPYADSSFTAARGSMDIPGPIVEVREMLLMYVPFTEAGRAF